MLVPTKSGPKTVIACLQASEQEILYYSYYSNVLFLPPVLEEINNHQHNTKVALLVTKTSFLLILFLSHKILRVFHSHLFSGWLFSLSYPSLNEWWHFLVCLAAGLTTPTMSGKIANVLTLNSSWWVRLRIHTTSKTCHQWGNWGSLF